MALTLALVIPLAMYLALRRSVPWLAGLYRIAAALAIAALLLTASRTAFGGLRRGLRLRRLDLARIGRAQKSGKRWLCLAYWLPLRGAYLAPPTARARLATLPAEATTGTFHQRTQIWNAGLKIIKDHPLLGVGVGGISRGARPWLASVGLAGRALRSA